MSRVGSMLKKAREDMGLSRKALGKKVGVSEVFVLDVETGKKIAQEALLKRISHVLNVRLDGVNYDEAQREIEESLAKMPLGKTYDVSLPKREESENKDTWKDNWKEAFGAIIKSIPIYVMDGTAIKSFKGVPADVSLVEGYSLDKLFYVLVNDDTMLHWRLREGDLVLCAKAKHFDKAGLYYIHYGGFRSIRFLRRIDTNNILVLSGKDGVDSQSINEKSFDVIGKCYRAEINL